jgi:predicted RNA-binding protein with PUA-like domain
MSDKAAVGIMEIARTAQKDGTEGNWVSVAVKPVEPLPRPVTLATMKADDRLSGMAMLRQSRLSVSPVREEEWSVLMELAGR